MRKDNNQMLRVSDWLPYNSRRDPAAQNSSLVIGSQFGPDGALYMSRFSVGCCRSNTTAAQQNQIVKISFNVQDECLTDTNAPTASHEVTGQAYPDTPNTYVNTARCGWRRPTPAAPASRTSSTASTARPTGARTRTSSRSTARARTTSSTARRTGRTTSPRPRPRRSRSCRSTTRPRRRRTPRRPATRTSATTSSARRRSPSPRPMTSSAPACTRSSTASTAAPGTRTPLRWRSTPRATTRRLPRDRQGPEHVGRQDAQLPHPLGRGLHGGAVGRVRRHDARLAVARAHPQRRHADRGRAGADSADGELTMPTADFELDAANATTSRRPGQLHRPGPAVARQQLVGRDQFTVKFTGGWQNAGLTVWQGDNNFFRSSITHSLSEDTSTSSSPRTTRPAPRARASRPAATSRSLPNDRAGHDPDALHARRRVQHGRARSTGSSRRPASRAPTG